jgi:hypothetical protein
MQIEKLATKRARYEHRRSIARGGGDICADRSGPRPRQGGRERQGWRKGRSWPTERG